MAEYLTIAGLTTISKMEKISIGKRRKKTKSKKKKLKNKRKKKMFSNNLIENYVPHTYDSRNKSKRSYGRRKRV